MIHYIVIHPQSAYPTSVYHYTPDLDKRILYENLIKIHQLSVPILIKMQDEYYIIWDCKRNLQDVIISLKTLRGTILAEINWENKQKFFALAKDLSEFSSMYNPLIKHIQELYKQNAGNFLDPLYDVFKKFNDDWLKLRDAYSERIANGNQNHPIETKRALSKMKADTENLKIEFEAKKSDVNKVINQCLGMLEELVTTKCVINSIRETDILVGFMIEERIQFVQRLANLTTVAWYLVKIMLRKPNMQQALQRRYEPIRNQYQIIKREDENGNFDSKLNTVAEEIREFTKKWMDPLLESHREVGEIGKEKASKNLENAMEAASKLGTAVRKIKAEWEAVKDDWGKTLCDSLVNGTKLYFQFSNTTD